jgi:cytochrome oxidase Cu insertion factor (SCO1/SenC/PrrC family)
MSSRTRASLLATVTVVVVVLAVIVIVGGPTRAGPSQTSTSISSLAFVSTGSSAGFDGAELPPGVRAHAFTLASLSSPPAGEPTGAVSLAQLKGRVVVLAFLYPACGRTCTLIAQQIRGALNELAKQPVVVIVSGSAEYAIANGGVARARASASTRAQTHSFLERESLTDSAYFLTGSPAQLRAVWRAYGITPASAGEKAFGEYAQVLLIGREGHERVVFGMEDLTAESLAHDIGKLQGG